MPATRRVGHALPTGTVTFLFTDIEGSTKLWEAHAETMRKALARHDALLREGIAGENGYVFKTVGDAFCAAFARASDAIAAALRVQAALAAEPWPERLPIKVRMALHTGAVESRDGDYFGQALNRVARLLPTCHGGQILVSEATYELTRDSLPEAASLADLGAHQLKDLARLERVYQLQHTALPGDFPPLKSLSTYPNNLPQQLTSFIGREKEIAAVKALLATTRVLTLTGSGGCGKTRLGLQVAADSLEKFAEGAWLVELAPLSDPSLVSQTVAKALDVNEAPGRPISQTLAEHLKHKRLLLLLDNCEHLLDACARLADTLARQCQGVKILAASREALGITGEQTYRVPSLSLPDRNEVPTPQTLSAYESVQLFIDRALLVRADFQVTNRNAPALASLCRHLDGIPLAIELAAARVRSLSVEEIDSKLDQRFRLLTRGSRLALPRQQTLRSLIDWSYDLLHDSEQRLLQRLSAFAGGWTLAAAEQVCAGADIEHAAVLDLLTSLADKSLVVMEQSDGRTRYGLLETVRQYAGDRLEESGGGEAVRLRHRDYFLALAEEARPQLEGAEEGEWLRRLEEEHENLRTALGWSLTEAEPSAALRLCAALGYFWGTRGHLAEGRKWSAQVLGKAGGEERRRERAKVINAAGIFATLQADYAAAQSLLEEGLAIVRELGDRIFLARVLENLGGVAREQGEYGAARSLFEEALAIERELGDKGGIARSLSSLGLTACEVGDFLRARSLLEESVALAREQGHRQITVGALRNLGLVAKNQGEFATARALYEEALAMERELGDRGWIAGLLNNLGELAVEQGDHACARPLYEESLAIDREVRDKETAYSLEGLAAVVAAVGSPLRAATIWGAAERLRADIGSPLPPSDLVSRDQRVASARAGLGDNAAFDRAWQEGRALALDHAIRLALD